MNARIPATGRSEVWPTIRRHAPPPTETVTLDMGWLGSDVPATVTYEATPATLDGSGRREPAYLTIYRVTTIGKDEYGMDQIVDLTPLMLAGHPDCLAEIKGKVKRKLRAEVV